MLHYSRGDAAPRRAKINDLPADNPASLFKLGMTADAAGNFYVASGVVGSSLCGTGGSSALVLISPVPTRPNPRCLVLPAVLAFSSDVAVSSVGNIPYLTVGNQVLRLNRLL